MRAGLFMMAALVTVTPAVAADQPLFRPTRDVEVEYRTNGMPQGMAPGGVAPGGTASGPGASAAGGVMTVHYTARTGRMRVESPNGRGYAIIDKAAGRMIIVMTQQHMYLEMPKDVNHDANMMGSLDEKNARFNKIGTDTVAGIGCTIYEATNGDHKGQICLTNDGVWLRARGEGQDDKHQVEAVKVTYAEQPASLFEPPADFRKMEMPTMPGGMPPGMGGPPTGGPPQR